MKQINVLSIEYSDSFKKILEIKRVYFSFQKLL
jgi:hypothetical protein